MGLTHSPIHLAYGLPLILVGILAFYLVGKLSPGMKKLLVFLALLIGLALFFTYTRSGILATGVGAIAVALCLKGGTRARLLLALLLVGGLFFFYNDSRSNRYAPGEEREGSAAARAVLWPVAVEIAKDNTLLGLGHDKFTGEAMDYSSVVAEEYEERFVRFALGRLQPHNDFLMVWVSFGTPALLAFAALFVGIFRSLRRSYIRASDPLMKAVSLSLIGTIPAYIANAATHNLMDSVYILWVLGGLSIAVGRLISSKQSLGRGV